MLETCTVSGFNTASIYPLAISMINATATLCPIAEYAANPFPASAGSKGITH